MAKQDGATTEGRPLREVLTTCGCVFDHPLLSEIMRCAPSAHKADDEIVRMGWPNTLAKLVKTATGVHQVHAGVPLWDAQILQTAVRPAEAMLIFSELSDKAPSFPFDDRLVAQSAYRNSPDDFVNCKDRPLLLRELCRKDRDRLLTTLDGDGSRQIRRQNIEGGVLNVLRYARLHEPHDRLLYRDSTWEFCFAERDDANIHFPAVTFEFQSILWTSDWPPRYCKLVTIEAKYNDEERGFERIRLLANVGLGPNPAPHQWHGTLMYEKVLIVNGQLRPGYGEAELAVARGWYMITPDWKLYLERDSERCPCIQIRRENMNQDLNTVRARKPLLEQLAPTVDALCSRSPRPLEEICGLGLFQRPPEEITSLQALLLEA